MPIPYVPGDPYAPRQATDQFSAMPAPPVRPQMSGFKKWTTMVARQRPRSVLGAIGGAAAYDEEKAQQDYENQLQAWRMRNQIEMQQDAMGLRKSRFEYDQEQDLLDAETSYARNAASNEQKLIDRQRQIEKDQAYDANTAADNARAEAAAAEQRRHNQALEELSRKNFDRLSENDEFARNKKDDKLTPEEAANAEAAEYEAEAASIATAGPQVNEAEKAKAKAAGKRAKQHSLKRGSDTKKNTSDMGSLRQADDVGGAAPQAVPQAAASTGKRFVFDPVTQKLIPK